MIEALVLGAGAAGLRAGAELLRKRVRVLVVEARDRVGGRVHSVEDRELGRVVELGAEFVHGPRVELKRAKLKLEEMDGRQMALLDGRLRDVTGQFRSVIGKLAGARGASTAQTWLATCGSNGTSKAPLARRAATAALTARAGSSLAADSRAAASRALMGMWGGVGRRMDVPPPRFVPWPPNL